LSNASGLIVTLLLNVCCLQRVEDDQRLR